MPVFTPTDLETLASGKTLPPAVFDAIVGDLDAVRRLHRLIRVRELVAGTSLPFDAGAEGGSTRFTPVADVGTVDLLASGEEAPEGPPSLKGFTFHGILGTGGFGRVWLAFDVAMKRHCAVKVVSSDGLHEAQTLAKMPTHRNRGQVFALHPHGDGACLVMEYVRGPSLRELLRQKPLPWPEAAKYVSQVAEGLRELHGAGILYRDIKPANIVLNEERGEVVVVDFGLASPSGQAEGSGTPDYMAPEAMEGRATPKSDVYSLAMTLFHLVVGRLPGKGELPGDLPRALTDLLEAALEPDAEKRIGLEAFLARARRVEVEDLADRLAELARDRRPVRLRVAVSAARNDAPETFSLATLIEATEGEGAVIRVRTGDLVRLEASADADGYFTVLCFASGGELSVLFSGGQQGHLTRAGETERLSFRAVPPTGTDTFGVVWSMHPWAHAGDAWRRLLRGEPVTMTVPTRSMTLVEARTLREDETWAGAVVSVVQE